MAFTSPKMALRIWNLLGDLYDHEQLADNLMRLDQHDHTDGRGVQIPTEGIADGAITNAKLSSVLTATPLDASVTAAKLAPALASSIGRAAFSAYRNSTLSIPGSGGDVAFDTEEFDTAGVFDPTTGRVVLPAGQTWRLSWRVGVPSFIGAITSTVYKSSTPWRSGIDVTDSSAVGGSSLVVGDGTSYFKVWLTHGSGSSQNITTGSRLSYFQGERVL